jgi:hypothetical protein|tara:strand:- start:1007 stop:1207 length:201 start_codon:yes stop_codon:yes gene_type:complete
MKKKKTYSKHDLRRSIEEISMTTQFIIQRLRTLETLFNDYIEMEDNEDKFKEFLDGKYKQPEHNES